MNSPRRSLAGWAGIILLALPFIVSGILHLAHPDTFLKIMPPYLPAHRELVALSGVIEAGLGILLLIPRTQRIAAWGLIATLIAVFPANIYMATSSLSAHPAVPEISPILSWLRLPIQPLLIVWAYAYARPPKSLKSVPGEPVADPIVVGR